MGKDAYVLTIMLAFYAGAAAQNIPPASIEDQVLGWIKPFAAPAVRAPLKIDHRVYSPAQLAIADDFARWIQASCMPKGGLGDLFHEYSSKLDPYNQNTASRPQSYGAYALTYFMLKYDSKKKMVPLSTDGYYFSVMANAVYGVATEALNTPTQYYFTLPSFEEAGYGFSPYERMLYDLSTHPRLGKHIHYYQRNSRIGNQQIVLLSKDRKSPFVTGDLYRPTDRAARE